MIMGRESRWLETVALKIIIFTVFEKHVFSAQNVEIYLNVNLPINKYL